MNCVPMLANCFGIRIMVPGELLMSSWTVISAVQPADRMVELVHDAAAPYHARIYDGPDTYYSDDDQGFGVTGQVIWFQMKKKSE